MVSVISQAASACHMGYEDIMSSSNGPTLFADYCHMRYVLATFAFSTHACRLTYLILCGPINIFCLLPCRNLLNFPCNRIDGGALALA